ncbi:MAG TPA: RHS repeat-associated core domain-containing protein [Bryobacteraceae bacterium]|nr:RHS repeat-associated core domain-containing protein [Bryobacteraceae bacterium]
MSAAEAAQQAARFTDSVEHGLGMLGMLAGMVLGAVVGALLIAATVATGGGALALALAVVGAVGATAGTGLAGGQLAHGLSTLFGCSGIVTGNIMPACSPNVHVGGKPSARAKLDGAQCNGLFGLNHFPNPLELIATGSSNVYINGMPAARQGDKLVCGADIKQGWSTVRIGGGTVQVLPIHDNEAWLRDILGKVALGALVAGALLLGGGFLCGAICGAAVLEAVGIGVAFFAGNELLGEIGDALGPGWRDTLQGGFGVGASLFAGYSGLRSISAGRPLLGEPIDGVTGEVCMWNADFALPAALALTLKREYASGSRHRGCFGPKWCSTWGQWVEVEGGTATWFSGDGRSIEFPLPENGSDWVRHPQVNKVRLRRAGGGFEVRDEQRHTLRFSHVFGERWQLSAIEDANGHSIHFFYDDAGALRRVEHSGGYRLHVEGTAAQIRRIALASGAEEIELVRYEYDESGRLAAVIDGSGRPFRYAYDDQARVTHWEDRNGTWYDYIYDSRGRCIHAIGPERLYHYQFTYDETARTNTAANSLGGVTTLVYNERMQVVERRDPLGGVARTEWDERNNTLRETDAGGRTVEREFDGDGRATLLRDGLGRTIRIRYNSLGLEEQLTDGAGNVWNRRYDERGNLVAAWGQDEALWSYERDASGNVSAVTDPEGHTRRFGYDRRGLMVWSDDARQQRTHFAYDGQGRILERVDTSDRRTAFTYNAQGKLATAKLSDGARLAWEYDPEGNLVRRLGPGDREYCYAYGPFDLLREVRKPSGGVIELSYDTEARLIGVRNEVGEWWRYTYDLNGQAVEQRDFTGRIQRFDYDASGLCTRQTTGSSQTVNLEWDAAGQLVRRVCSDGTRTEFEYDPRGLMTRARNNATDTQLDLDAYGRVVREVRDGREVTSEYDLRGLRVRRRTSGGRECEWRWDPNGEVESMRLPGDQWLEFVRDAAGNNVERRMRGGFILRQQYDAVGRLLAQSAGLETVPEAAAVVKRAYRYAETGAPVEISDARWGTVRFAYDPDGRIASAERQGARREDFEYDAAGNMTRASLALHFYSEGGRLQRAGETSYVYDGDGRVVEKRQGDRSWRYHWNGEGHLTAVETPDGQYWRYTYDAFGRRVSKQGPSGTMEYLWDGPVVAEEVKNGKSAGWEYDPGTFRPVVKQENGKTFACVTDQVGTPRELVDKGGTVAWRAQFTTWGEAQEVELRKTDCPIRFQGQWSDPETGLHYNRFRHYDPSNAIYLSPDPIGLVGGTRQYGYVANPLAWVDPLGLAQSPPNSPFYEVGFEAQLQQGVDYPGHSDRAHFAASNKQLYQAMQSDPQFAQAMEQNYPGITQGVEPGPRGAFPRRSPTSDTTWHHVADREGAMQLVPTEQHQASGPVQESLHPNQRGGMQNWGGGRGCKG